MSFYRRLPTSYSMSGWTSSGSQQPTIYISDGGGTTSGGNSVSNPEAYKAASITDAGQLVFTKISGAQDSVYLKSLKDFAYNKETNSLDLTFYDATKNRSIPISNAFTGAILNGDTGRLTLTRANGATQQLTPIDRAVTSVTMNAERMTVTYGNTFVDVSANPLAAVVKDISFNSDNDMVLLRANGSEKVVDLPSANAIMSLSLTAARKLRYVHANNTPGELALDFSNAVANMVYATGSGSLRVTYANNRDANIALPCANAYTDAVATTAGLTLTRANGAPHNIPMPSANALTGLSSIPGGLGLSYSGGAFTSTLPLPSANAFTGVSRFNTELRFTRANDTQTVVSIPNGLTSIGLTEDRNLGFTLASGTTDIIPIDSFSNAVSSVVLNQLSNQLTVRHANGRHANVTLPSANAFTDVQVDAANRFVFTQANGAPKNFAFPSANAMTDIAYNTARDLVLTYANNTPRTLSLGCANAATTVDILSNGWGNRLRVVYANNITDTSALPFGNAVTAVEFNSTNDMLLKYANTGSMTALRIPFANAVANARITAGRDLQVTYANGVTGDIQLNFSNSVSNIGLVGGNSIISVALANGGYSNVSIPFGNAVTNLSAGGTGGMDLTMTYANGGARTLALPTTSITDLAIEANGLRRTLLNGTSSYSNPYPFATTLTGVSTNPATEELIFTRAAASSLVVNLSAWSNAYVDARISTGRQLSLTRANGGYQNVELTFANAVTNLEMNNDNMTVSFANDTSKVITYPIRLANVQTSGEELKFRYSNGTWSNISVSSANAVNSVWFDPGNASRLVVQKESGATASVFLPAGNAVMSAEIVPESRYLRLTHANGNPTVIPLNFSNAMVSIRKTTGIDFEITRANNVPITFTVPDAAVSGTIPLDRSVLTLNLANGGSSNINIASFSNTIAGLEIRGGNSELAYRYANATVATIPMPVCFRDFTVGGDGQAVFTWSNNITKSLTVGNPSAITKIERDSGNGALRLTTAGAGTAWADFSGSFGNAIKKVIPHSDGLQLTYANSTVEVQALPFANAFTSAQFLAGTSRNLRLTAPGGAVDIPFDFSNSVTGGYMNNGMLYLSLANSGPANIVDVSSFSNPVRNVDTQANSIRLWWANNTSKDIYLPANSSANIVTVTDSVRFIGPTGSTAYIASANRSGNTGFVITSAAGSALMYLSSAGDIRVIGDVVAKDVITLSDARLKLDPEPITGALDRIQKLQGYTYTIGGQRRAGLIAQDVRPVLPEAVDQTEDGNLAVMYNGLSALYVEAFKALRADVEDLKAAVSQLKSS